MVTDSPGVIVERLLIMSPLQWRPAKHYFVYQGKIILSDRYYHSHFIDLHFQGLGKLSNNHSANEKQSPNLDRGLSESKAIFLIFYLIPGVSLHCAVNIG